MQKLEDNFLGTFGNIWAKILCTPKNLLAPTPVTLCMLYPVRIVTWQSECTFLTASVAR